MELRGVDADQFLDFEIRLRDKILDNPTSVLHRLGAAVGFDASLESGGLPSRATVIDLMEDFRQGRRGMGDLALASIWPGRGACGYLQVQSS